jgi:hypothetical protein
MSALHGASDSGSMRPTVPSLAILLVDDEPSMVKALTVLLRRSCAGGSSSSRGIASAPKPWPSWRRAACDG